MCIFCMCLVGTVLIDKTSPKVDTIAEWSCMKQFQLYVNGFRSKSAVDSYGISKFLRYELNDGAQNAAYLYTCPV